MAESHSAFIGEIPRNYEKYLGPLIFSEYAEDLANRITVPTGGMLLETAAALVWPPANCVTQFLRMCALWQRTSIGTC